MQKWQATGLVRAPILKRKVESDKEHTQHRLLATTSAYKGECTWAHPNLVLKDKEKVSWAPTFISFLLWVSCDQLPHVPTAAFPPL